MQPLVGVEASHLSQQLAVLRRAGVVTTRKDGAAVIYALRDPEIVELLAVAKRVLINSLTQTQDLLADLRSEVTVASVSAPCRARCCRTGRTTRASGDRGAATSSPASPSAWSPSRSRWRSGSPAGSVRPRA